MRLFALLLLLVALPAQAFETEEFDLGPGHWTPSPRRIGRSTTEGWKVVSNDGEKAIRTSASRSRYTYYWKLTRQFDLSETEDPELDLKAHFRGGDYAWFRVLIGPAGARRNSDFTVLHEETEGSAGPETRRISLSEYAGQTVTIRLQLKKPHGVVATRIGLYVHRIGLLSAARDRSADDQADVLRVAAFNVQVFGRSKMSKPLVVDTLVRTFLRYDLIAMQEIRDSSGAAVEELLTRLNAVAETPYSLVLSERLGRTTSREQYGFFVRGDKVRVVDSFQVDDSAEDVFEREPFAVKLATQDGAFDFLVVALHAAPDSALSELNGLGPVVDSLALEAGEDQVLLLGDFNAGCSYLPSSQMQALPLWTDPRFTWWIDYGADTTTTPTHCAYDRLVTTSGLTERVAAFSSGIFRFDQSFGLSPTETRQVSDHYPVHLNLQLR